MIRKNIRIISILSIVFIIILVIFYNMNNRYKNDIGAYDIYTLVKLEKELEDFIQIYNSNELDIYSMKLFHEEMLILLEYLRRSPKLRFMNHPLMELIDYELEDIKQVDIDWMLEIQKEVRRITLDIHDRSKGDNIGLLTYEYFDNKDNIKNLIEILESKQRDI